MMAMHAPFSKGKNTYLILLFGAGLSFRRAFCYNRIAFCLRDVVRRLFAQVRCDADVLREIMKECRNW